MPFTALAFLIALPALGIGAEHYFRSVPGPADTMTTPPCTPSCTYLGPSYTNVPLLPNSSVHQSEMSIAFNPNLASILLVGANTTSGPDSDRTCDEGTYWSLNGSSAWTGNNDAPLTPRKASDPTVGIANMKYWMSYVERDSSDQWQVKLARGNTPGDWTNSWQVPSVIMADKPHMAVDGAYGGPYVAYVEYGGNPQGAKRIHFSKYDPVPGQMTPPLLLSPAPASSAQLFHGPNVVIGTNGDVYVAWAVYDTGWIDMKGSIFHETGMGFVRLTNSGTILDFRLDSIPGLGVRGIMGPLKPSHINVNSFPSMAVDRSGGPHRGNIYMVWADRRNPDGTPDIYLTRSQNGGNTWSPPICVNDGGGGTDQWMPWVTVDPNGYLHVVYYDSRDDWDFNEYAAVYISSSYDGGQSFDAGTPVSDKMCKVCPIPGTRSNELGGYMGDYIGIASVSGIAYPCWNDGRTGIQQAFTAAVPRNTPPPPGGCPYVYAWDGREYQQDNTILGQCESPRTDRRPVTDFLRLQQPLVADADSYKLQIREFEQEKSYLDALELLVVDYPRDAEMDVAPSGEVFLYGQAFQAVAAYDHSGRDVLDLISTRDGKKYSSYDAGAMYVEYEVRRPGVPGVLYDPIPPGEEPLGIGPPQKRGNPGSGVLVQVEDHDGSWHSVDVQPPRGNPQDALWLLNKAEGYESGSRIRVRISWNDQFETDQLAYYSVRLDQPTVAQVRPVAAVHSLQGETRHLLAEVDGESATLEPGEVLELSFATSKLPDLPAEWTRGFILKSTGYYEAAAGTISSDVALSQNKPNPFNAGTEITFTLQRREPARLEVYNVLGQRLVTLMDGLFEAGVHTASWDGRDEHGGEIPTGVYLYRLTHGARQETRKMTLLR